MNNVSHSPDRLKPAGGVRSVILTPAVNVRNVLFHMAGNKWLRCNMVDEEQAMNCTLVEDRSSFEEQLTDDEGLVSVRHRLRLVSDRNFAEHWLDEGFVEECRRDGVVAIATLGDGRMVLVGYSQKFCGEQPLRLKSLTVRSGSKPSDVPTVEMVLESVDTSFAVFQNPK